MCILVSTLQFFRLKQVGQFGVKRFKRDGYGCILEPKNGRYYGEGITQQFENFESVSKPLENFCIALNLCDSSRMMDPTVNPLTAKFCQLQAEVYRADAKWSFYNKTLPIYLGMFVILDHKFLLNGERTKYFKPAVYHLKGRAFLSNNVLV